MAIHRLELDSCSTNVGQCRFYLELDQTICLLVNISGVNFHFDSPPVLTKFDLLAKILQFTEKNRM